MIGSTSAIICTTCISTLSDVGNDPAASSPNTPSKVGNTIALAATSPEKDDMDDTQLCQVISPSSVTSFSTTASTTAAKKGGEVVEVIVLDQIIPPSKKPKNKLLHACFKITPIKNGENVLVECQKCPTNITKPPYRKTWKRQNSTIMMDHLTRNCVGVDISL